MKTARVGLIAVSGVSVYKERLTRLGVTCMPSRISIARAGLPSSWGAPLHARVRGGRPALAVVQTSD